MRVATTWPVVVDDRPLEPFTGLPVRPVHLALAAVPIVFAGFLSADLAEQILFAERLSPTLRLLHLARGIALTLVFSTLAAAAVGLNWRRAMERVRVAEARAHESERLRWEAKRLADLADLAIEVCHEVGNPIAVISAQVQLLDRKTADAGVKERLARMTEGVERIAMHLQRLRDVASRHAAPERARRTQ